MLSFRKDEQDSKNTKKFYVKRLGHPPFHLIIYMGEYDDIINLPHYEPKNHPRMSMWKRAAQFAPFAALTGYEEAVKETERKNEESYEPKYEDI